jgi:hypothetical protein
MKEKFPAKNSMDVLEKEIDYCQQLIKVVEKEDTILAYPRVKEPLNLLKETVEDDLEHLQISVDQDARVGHKSADTSFFGYKTHLAMTEERIITAATITTGEKNGGKQLEALVEKSMATGIKIENIIGDAAYSEKANIEISRENNIRLVAKLNPSVSQGFRKKAEEFEFNKDAGMYVCKAGQWLYGKPDKERKA